MAVSHGIPTLLGDVIDMPIGKDRYVREKQAVRKIENGGRSAVTEYHVVERIEGVQIGGEPSGEGAPIELLAGTHPHDKKLPQPPANFSLIKLLPKTGRTHQLRVHLSHLKYPIVGDVMYGGRTFVSGDFRFERQALHAYEITFIHPGTLDPMTLTAPLPPDINRLLELLRAAAKPKLT